MENKSIFVIYCNCKKHSEMKQCKYFKDQKDYEGICGNVKKACGNWTCTSREAKSEILINELKAEGFIGKELE